MQGILVGEDESQTVRAIGEIMGLQL
jgi:hypothetical protein